MHITTPVTFNTALLMLDSASLGGVSVALNEAGVPSNGWGMEYRFDHITTPDNKNVTIIGKSGRIDVRETMVPTDDYHTSYDTELQIAYVGMGPVVTLRYQWQARLADLSVLVTPLYAVANAKWKDAVILAYKMAMQMLYACRISTTRRASLFTEQRTKTPEDIFDAVPQALDACMEAYKYDTDGSKNKYTAELALYNRLSDTARIVIDTDEGHEACYALLPEASLTSDDLEYTTVIAYVPKASVVLGDMPLVGPLGEEVLGRSIIKIEMNYQYTET